MEREQVMLYIYREGAVVEEVRSATCPSTASTDNRSKRLIAWRLDDISKEIHEATFRLLSKQELQGYTVHDITSPPYSDLSKLLLPLIGKNVTVQSVRKSETGGVEISRSGTLINIVPNNYVVLRCDDTLTLINEDITQLSSSDDVQQLIVEQPYIEARILTGCPEGLPETLRFSYHTAGMSWRLAYDATLSDDYSALSIVGKLAVKNETGVVFEQAMVRVVDGDLTELMMLKQQQPQYEKLRAYPIAQQARSIEETKIRGSEYETYELPGRLSIEKTEALQFLRFFKEENIAASRRYVLHTDSPDYAQLIIDWKNSSNALLPPGDYMVSRRKANGDMELLGNVAMDSIPVNRQVQMKMGSVFSIRGRRETVEKVSDSQRQDSPGLLFDVFKYRLTVHNDRESDIDLDLREQLLEDNWIIKDSSYSIVGQDTAVDFRFRRVKKKPNSEERETRVARATVSIPAASTAVIEYTVEYQKSLAR